MPTYQDSMLPGLAHGGKKNAVDFALAAFLQVFVKASVQHPPRPELQDVSLPGGIFVNFQSWCVLGTTTTIAS
eukprot:2557982-Rhodomonas_salina.3